MFQQADRSYHMWLQDARLRLLKSSPRIVQGFAWAAVPWQHEQGVEPTDYNNPKVQVPADLVHPAPGAHKILNNYLTNYIQEHKILS